VTGQAVKQLRAARGRGRGLIDDDDVQAAQQLLVLPERLPDNSFQGIPARRLTAMFL